MGGEVVKTQQELLRQVEDALWKLACLGNGSHFGNSHGNVIAQQALPVIDELLRMANGVVCEMESLDFENGTKITFIAPDDSKWTSGKYLVTPQPDEGKL